MPMNDALGVAAAHAAHALRDSVSEVRAVILVFISDRGPQSISAHTGFAGIAPAAAAEILEAVIDQIDCGELHKMPAPGVPS